MLTKKHGEMIVYAPIPCKITGHAKNALLRIAYLTEWAENLALLGKVKTQDHGNQEWYASAQAHASKRDPDLDFHLHGTRKTNDALDVGAAGQPIGQVLLKAGHIVLVKELEYGQEIRADDTGQFVLVLRNREKHHHDMTEVFQSDNQLVDATLSNQ